jgi:cyclohexadieny/prephenate dehydrogenase
VSGEVRKEPLFEKITIIGIGLIGSSLARVALARNLARTIVLADRSSIVCQRAKELQLSGSVMQDIPASVEQADLIILCVPVGATADVAIEIAPHLKAGAIVSDVGSVKGAVVDALQQHLPPSVSIVPAHPVAGTEYSGPDAGFSTLFENRWCILTPPENTLYADVEKVHAFWTACGANVEQMTARHHDLVLAITSHVPHLIAFNIVGTAADLEEVTQSEVIKFSAGGFRDFTRIAASDPTMWRDVFLNNKDAVLEMLGRFNEDLAALQRMIRWDDAEGLFELFTRTRAIRRSIIDQGQETPAPNFGRGPQLPDQ